MGKLAYLFPGQGSQSVGMGADLCAHSSAALDVFDEADALLGLKLSTVCFYGPEDALRDTLNAQPALFVMSVAALRALEEAGAPSPDAVAGHSVGEYAALVAAGALSLEVGLQLVQRRAQEMFRAGETNPGTMAAVLGLPGEEVAAVCAELESPGAGLVQVANFNGGGQVVISGTIPGVTNATEALKARGAKRVVPLNVSGAFHSRLMGAAAQAIAYVLRDATINNVSVPIVANVTADYERSAEEIRNNLAAQIDHPVRWEESMTRLVQDGFDRFIEVGSGTVLSGLMKRLAPGAAFGNANDFASVQSCVQTMTNVEQSVSEPA